jgi:hypothetical protein
MALLEAVSAHEGVMAGLDPAIHAFDALKTGPSKLRGEKGWIL